MMASTSRKKVVNKIILFPIDKILIPQARMKDSLKRYVSTMRKSCFHRQKYLKKLVKTGFKQQERDYCIKNGFTQHNTSTTFALSKRRISRKFVSTRRNEAFDKKSVSTSPKNCFRCQDLKNSKKIGLNTSRKKLRIKAPSLQLIKNPFPLARMKDSLKNAISLDRRATSIRVSI